MIVVSHVSRASSFTQHHIHILDAPGCYYLLVLVVILNWLLLLWWLRFNYFFHSTRLFSRGIYVLFFLQRFYLRQSLKAYVFHSCHVQVLVIFILYHLRTFVEFRPFENKLFNLFIHLCGNLKTLWCTRKLRLKPIRIHYLLRHHRLRLITSSIIKYKCLFCFSSFIKAISCKDQWSGVFGMSS